MKGAGRQAFLGRRGVTYLKMTAREAMKVMAKLKGMLTESTCNAVPKSNKDIIHTEKF